MYLFNLILVLINTLRICNKKDVMYYPQIKFYKSAIKFAEKNNDENFDNYKSDLDRIGE